MARILIEHVHAITLDDTGRVLPDAALAVEGRRLVGVGLAPEGFAPDEVLDGRGLLALPGLFNAHCHAAMTLLRGWAEDLPFDRWLNERIWVGEAGLQEQDVRWGAALAACEMIRAGVVGFADHYFYMDQVAAVAQESGMKALLAWCHFGRGPEGEVGGVSFEQTLDFVRRWQGAGDGRLRTALGPHSPYICPPQVLRRAAEAARRLGVALHLHLAESEQQVRTSLQAHGLRPVAHLEQLGVLQVPRCLAAHCIAVDAQDIALLAARRVQVAVTPKTYMKLAMGMPPLARLLQAGVGVSLGTDGAASNTDLDLLEVCRLTGLTQKWIAQDAGALPVLELLRLATRAGAQALGFTDSGALAPGMAADLVLLSTAAPRFCPAHDLPALVAYAAHPGDVTHVMCDGRWLLRDRQLLTLDEERIRAEVARRAARLVASPRAALRTYEG